MKRKITSLFILGMLVAALSGCTAPADVNSSNTENVIAEIDIADNTEENKEDDSYADAEKSDIVDEGSAKTIRETPEFKIELEDGSYMVDFDTDSSMFHVNEAMNGQARLTVKNGTAMLYLVMPSKNVLNLYEGVAEDADADEAYWINPVTALVTYDDGITEEVFGFYVPVYVMDEEFDLALVGKKEIWYDHKVSISNPQALEDEVFTIEAELEGGSGRAYIENPIRIKNTEDGYIATIIWSSKYYDYMIVDDVKYLPVLADEHSVFEIPVADLNKSLEVVADTTAMSEPHEIEYSITFNVTTMY